MRESVLHIVRCSFLEAA